MPESQPEINPPLPVEEKKKQKLVIADITEGAEAMARDTAESKRSQEYVQLGGIKNIIKRIWKFNLADEFYRQKEIGAAREKILESKNLYGFDAEEDWAAHAQTIQSIVERFADEYEEDAIHREAGEVKEALGTSSEETALRGDLKDLVKEYARGTLDDQAFREEKARLFKELSLLRPEVFRRSELYADNLFEIAKSARNRVEHGERLEDLDLDFDVIVGRAKTGVRTQTQYNAVDKAIERISKTKAGALVHETTLAAGVSIAYSLAAAASRRLASSRLFAFASFGGTAALGATLAGLRAKKELEDKRRQHFREMAQGKRFDPDRAPQRKTLEEFRYETRSARELVSALESRLYERSENKLEVRADLTQGEFDEVLGHVAEIDARIRVSDRHNIDLISHTDIAAVETERLELDRARAKAKVELQKVLDASGDKIALPQDLALTISPAAGGRVPAPSLKDYLFHLTETRAHQLVSGDEGIERKNALFQMMKRKEIAKSVLIALGSGMLIGAAAQELGAAIGGQRTPELLKGSKAEMNPPRRLTFLEWLTRSIRGEEPLKIPSQEVAVEQLRVRCPENAQVLQDADGSFRITQGNEVLAQNIRVNPDGTLPEETRNLLAQKQILAQSGIRYTQEMKGHTAALPPQEYLERHRDLVKTISRDDWYHQNSPRNPTGNALKLWWGGKGGAGINDAGQYEFSVRAMTPHESFNQRIGAVDPTELRKNGSLKLFLSLSRETQNQIFEVPVDPDGKIRVDPDSTIGKLFFARDDKGKAAFVGKFAEVGFYTNQDSKDGAPLVRILATHTGKGVETIQDVIEEPIPKQPNPWIDLVPCPPAPETPPVVPPPSTPETLVEPPPFLPLARRKPLEALDSKVAYPYYYSYFANAYEAQHLRADMSPRLKENPDAKLDPAVEIPWYFEDQERRYPGYVEELKTLNRQMSAPMGPNTRAAVALAVAGHQEHKNIYRTLQTYAVQKDRKGSSVWKGQDSDYEITLYVNWPRGTSPKKTIKEIERFQKNYPDVPVRVYREEITNGKKELGWYKKKAFDLPLWRHMQRGRNDDIYIIANDADMVYTSPTYLEQVTSYMNGEEAERYDALLGRYDLDPAIYEKNPTFHSALRFWQFTEAIIRSKYKLVGTQGRNTVMRGSSYAAVGGNRTKAFWADVEFGKLFGVARNRYDAIAYLNRAWVMVDPRREIDKFKRGERIAWTWNDFDTREVRGVRKNAHAMPEEVNIKRLAKLSEDDPEVRRFKERLEDEIQAIVELFSVISPLYATAAYGEDRTAAGIRVNLENTVRRAAKQLGVDLSVTPGDSGLRIALTNTAKLRKNLLAYREQGRKKVKIRKNPLR